jgi:hypothetical protein
MIPREPNEAATLQESSLRPDQMRNMPRGRRDARCDVRIDWFYSGRTDLSAGTGATATEQLLPLAGAILLPVWLVLAVVSAGTIWTFWQWIIALALAPDLGRGVVANGLNSCKRFYHTPAHEGEGAFVRAAKNHWLFTAFHLHPIIVYAMWAPDYLWVGLVWYGVLLLSVAVVRAVPLYLARPVAFLLVGAAIVAQPAVVPSIPHLEWLVPLLFLKIVLGHSVQEEPYRPVERSL